MSEVGNSIACTWVIKPAAQNNLDQRGIKMSESAAHNRRHNRTGLHNAPCSAHPKKTRYRDDQQAKRALNTMKRLAQSELQEFGKTKFNQVRSYPCNACKGWHTTSELPSGKKHYATITEAQTFQQMCEIAFADEIREAQKVNHVVT
jgi:hypothetical protein